MLRPLVSLSKTHLPVTPLSKETYECCPRRGQGSEPRVLHGTIDGKRLIDRLVDGRRGPIVLVDIGSVVSLLSYDGRLRCYEGPLR